MRILIVEDSFITRQVMVKMLSPLGQCDVAVNGREAVVAFTMALEAQDRYNLVCLDIMMPEMNGREALKKIREIEAQRGILGLDGVKVIMTTAEKSSDVIMGSFREGCEAYLVKPITQEKLYREMEKLGLRSGEPADSIA
jgi:two-component system, chemotaxis family, chemotaxis protein CheY